jgi:type I restriction-modification system DNA methylase subunit
LEINSSSFRRFKMAITLDEIKKIVRSAPYMDGIDQTDLNINKYGQFFTPNNEARDAIETLFNLDPTLFTDLKKTIIDPVGCGSGDFLLEALIKKIENGSTHEEALKTLYGVDIDQKNVDLCRKRLLCGEEHLRPIVERNIVCADALKYQYRFDGSDPYKTDQDLHIERLFS